MSIRCPKCGREFDVTLFEFGRSITCPCGETVSLHGGHAEGAGKRGGDEPVIDWGVLEKEIFGAVDRRQREEDWERMQRIRRQADRIVSLILYSDMPRVDIEIQISTFRRSVLEQFPDKQELFDAIYIGRFRRLWDQFKPDEDPLFGE
jgi:hypothetical protein